MIEQQRVRVYYNLHKHCLSVMDKKTRLVIAHVDSIQLDNVKFVVSAAGLARLRKRKRKSVIAFIEGDYSMAYGKWGDCDEWPQAYFDPYKVDQFMMGERPIHEADQVRIEDKNIYIKEKMRKLLVLMLLALVPASFTSCRHGRTGKQGDSGINGQDGQNGQNGQDGLNGADGLNGIGFDYVRSMDGATVCNSALIVPADLVVPTNILALAPPEGEHGLEGLTLTFGSLDSPIRVYLGKVRAGEYCVLEKLRGEGWVPVGEQLIFTEDGYVAIVPPEFYNFVHPPVFSDALLSLHIVEFTGECNELNYSSNHFKIGKDIRINFNRN